MTENRELLSYAGLEKYRRIFVRKLRYILAQTRFLWLNQIIVNKTKTVFLSGPIRGLSRADSLGWRNLAVELLSSKFNVLHALRGREEKEVFTDPRAAVIRDLNDVYYCDVLLVNDTYSEASMIGTAMEVFYAHQNNKPIIIFGNAHSKDYWLNYHSHLRVDTLEEACKIINDMFS